MIHDTFPDLMMHGLGKYFRKELGLLPEQCLGDLHGSNVKGGARSNISTGTKYTFPMKFKIKKSKIKESARRVIFGHIHA